MQITSNKKLSVNILVKVSILVAIGYVLMFISIPIPIFFPSFLKIDISDITAVLGGITLGPIYGVVICFLKNLLQFITGLSTTGGVGEFANFLIGSSFIYTSSKIFKKGNLLISLLLGTISMVIVGCLSNYFIILPFYSTIMPIDVVISMGNKLNPLVVNKISFIIFMIIPFNLLKSFILSSVVILVHDKIKKFL